MMKEPDFTPDPADILQAEPGYEDPAVKVCVDGPVRTQELPRVSSGVRSINVPDGPPVRLLAADPTRAIARIITMDSTLLVGGSAQEIAGGQPGHIPVNLVVPFTSTDELWGAALDSESTVVTVMQERWANG